MTVNVQADGGFDLQPIRATDRWPNLTGWLVLVVLFAAGIVMRQLVAANSDVSWLLIAGERWLDGQRLYSDILETNPPMAVMVYIPGILIARALDLPAERVVDALVMSAVALSLALGARILRRSNVICDDQRWPVAITALLVLAVLPVQSFGQREHIAVIELMPVFAVLALRINREVPPLWSSAIAGVGLGLALCFKPHFSLAMLCVFGVVAAHLKSCRVLFGAEAVVAAVVVVGYGACTLLFFPEYFDEMWPLLRDVYSIGLPLHQMVMKPAVALWAFTLAAALVLKRGGGARPTMLLLLTGSIAFGFVYLLQRKGWPYHSYPMMAFAWLGLGYALGSGERDSGPRPGKLSVGTAAAAASLFMAGMVWFNHVIDARMLQPAITRLGLAHPTILAISGDGGLAHPLTRAVGGVWVSRQQTLLIASYADYLRQTEYANPQRLAALNPYLERERRWLIDDFQRARPAIVLVDNMTGDWGEWLHASPELERLLSDYHLSETVASVDIYVRRSN